MTGWLAFYLPSHPPVEQINGRMRYVNAPEPDPALFRGAIMYVCMVECDEMPLIRQRFTSVEKVTSLDAGSGTACRSRATMFTVEPGRSVRRLTRRRSAPLGVGYHAICNLSDRSHPPFGAGKPRRGLLPREFDIRRKKDSVAISDAVTDADQITPYVHDPTPILRPEL